MAWTLKTAMVKCPFCNKRHGVKMYVSKQLAYVDRSLVDEDGDWRDDRRTNARLKRNISQSEDNKDELLVTSDDDGSDSGNDTG